VFVFAVLFFHVDSWFRARADLGAAG